MVRWVLIPWLARGRGWPRPPVSVARGAHLGRVEQRPFRCGRPPSVSAVAATEFLHGAAAVFAAQPAPDPSPGVGAQVGEGCAGHAGPEVGAPAPQHLVQPEQQDFQRLVRADLPAHCLHLAGHGLDGLARRVGVDIGPAGASFAVALDAPAQKHQTLVDVGDECLVQR